MNDRIRRRLELRRSSAASPHRNKTRFAKATRNDWKGFIMNDPLEVWNYHDESIVVQREGSSQRTVEELSLRFVEDALDLAVVSGPNSEIEALQSLLTEGLASTDSLDALDDIVHETESRLSDMGYSVEWNDGYIIFKA